MKEETAVSVILRKFLYIIITIIVVAWFALGIYNPWYQPQDCDYEDTGCVGDTSKFGQ